MVTSKILAYTEDKVKDFVKLFLCDEKPFFFFFFYFFSQKS
jgi:hypothetical protein